MTDKPLVYTSRGNLPIEVLTFETEWDVQDTYIKFTERYRDISGEVVREDSHVYDKRGITAEIVGGQIG